MKKIKEENLYYEEKLLFLLMIALVLELVACENGETEDPDIKRYTRNTTSGTRDNFFTTFCFSDTKTDNTPLVSRYIEAEGNGKMISYLKDDKFDIGYISLSSLVNSRLKGLKYNGIIPTEVNVNNGTYALTRNFNYVIRDEFDAHEE